MKIYSCAVILMLSPTLSSAETHEVLMLNRSESGSMVYEPDHLHLALGDTVRFIATHPSHNAASIPQIWPGDVAQVMGRIDEEIEITFDEPGVYGIKCSPHYTMGMVMLIEVGSAADGKIAIPPTLPDMARDRLADILARIGGAQGV